MNGRDKGQRIQRIKSNARCKKNPKHVGDSLCSKTWVQCEMPARGEILRIHKRQSDGASAGLGSRQRACEALMGEQIEDLLTRRVFSRASHQFRGPEATKTRDEGSVEPRAQSKVESRSRCGYNIPGRRGCVRGRCARREGRQQGRRRSEREGEEKKEKKKRRRQKGEKRSPQKSDGRTGPHEDHCGKWWEGRRGTGHGDWPRGGEQNGQDVGRTLGRDSLPLYRFGLLLLPLTLSHSPSLPPSVLALLAHPPLPFITPMFLHSFDSSFPGDYYETNLVLPDPILLIILGSICSRPDPSAGTISLTLRLEVNNTVFLQPHPNLHTAPTYYNPILSFLVLYYYYYTHVKLSVLFVL